MAKIVYVRGAQHAGKTQPDYPPDLKRTLMHKWFRSAVAAIFTPSGFSARGVLVLQGPQAAGKTSWVRALISDPALRESVLRLDHHLDGSSKDTVITAVTHWIVEIGELDSSFRKDIARLKGLITSDTDKVRLPYRPPGFRVSAPHRVLCDREWPAFPRR